MHRVSLLSHATALAVLLLPATALADVVPSPPTDCPNGSHGRTGHAGPWCNPTTCTTDADCREEGTACREAALCVETEEYRMGGWAGDQRSTREVAHGACGADGQCAEGECRRAKYCVHGGGGGGGTASSDGEEHGEAEGEEHGAGGEEHGAGGEAGDEERGSGGGEGHANEAEGAGTEPTAMGRAGAGAQPGAGPTEEEDDGGCSATGAGRCPAWALLLVLSLAVRARRRH